MGELALLIPLAPFILGGFVIWTRLSPQGLAGSANVT